MATDDPQSQGDGSLLLPWPGGCGQGCLGNTAIGQPCEDEDLPTAPNLGL